MIFTTDCKGRKGTQPISPMNPLITHAKGEIVENGCKPLQPLHKTVDDLLEFCKATDVRLWTEAGQVRYSAPAGVVDEDLRAELVKHKADLLGRLDTQAGKARSPWRVTAIGGTGRVGTHSVVRPGSPTHKAPASEAPSDPSADARDSWLALGLVEIRPGVFAAPGYEDWTF